MTSFFPSHEVKPASSVREPCYQVHVSPRGPSPTDNNGTCRAQRGSPLTRRRVWAGTDWSPGRGNLGPTVPEPQSSAPPVVSAYDSRDSGGEPEREEHGSSPNSGTKCTLDQGRNLRKEKPKPGQGQTGPGGRGGAGKRRRPRPARPRPAAPNWLPRRAAIPPPPGPAQDGGPAAAAQPVPSPAPWALSATRAGLDTPSPAPPEWGGAGRAGGPLPAAARGGRGRAGAGGAYRERSGSAWLGPWGGGERGGGKGGARKTTQRRRRRLPLRSRRPSRGRGGGALEEPARCLMGRLRVSLRASELPFFSPTRKAGTGMCAALRVLEGPGAQLCAGSGRRSGTRSGLERPWVRTASRPAILKPGLHRIWRRGNTSSGASLCVTASSLQAWKVRRSRKRGAIKKKHQGLPWWRSG